MNCVIGRIVISQVGIHGNAQSCLADLLLLLLPSFLSSSTGRDADALNNFVCREL